MLEEEVDEECSVNGFPMHKTSLRFTPTVQLSDICFGGSAVMTRNLGQVSGLGTCGAAPVRLS
ncbi:hypothetical protein J6590_084270 [Homalodisca vitripennis]|nr:hypothetical protein J6590_084270 [Homalodisca vitripennis]